MLADELTKLWGKPVLVENKGGAGGAVGSIAVVRAAADGHTLLMGSSGPIVVAPQVSRTAGYDPRRDMTAVVNVAGVPQMMVVASGSTYKSVQDVIAAARKAPGKLSYGTGGTGSLAHLTMELFKKRADVDILHIPYKGAAPAYTDLLAGRLDVSSTRRRPRWGSCVRGNCVFWQPPVRAARRFCRKCRRSPSQACRASMCRAGSAYWRRPGPIRPCCAA
jgi:tripartite-type tricarboxylate transporter receptor subunit TctC